MSEIPTTLEAEITALRPMLLASARRHTLDEAEAAHLVLFVVNQALREAAESKEAGSDDDDIDTQQRLMSLMRSAFHSVERRRDLARTRRPSDRPWNPELTAVYATPKPEQP